MIRRPPRATRTDTLFPYTTLVRSQCLEVEAFGEGAALRGVHVALHIAQGDTRAAGEALRHRHRLRVQPVVREDAVGDAEAQARRRVQPLGQLVAFARLARAAQLRQEVAAAELARQADLGAPGDRKGAM